MGNPRFVLITALGFIVMLMWLAWQEDYGPASRQSAISDGRSAQPVGVSDPASALAANDGELPSLSDSSSLQRISPVDVASRGVAETDRNRKIHVVTDLLDVWIDTKGGEISMVSLRAYPIALDKPDEPFPLLLKVGDRYYVAQSGLLSRQGAPSHLADFQAEKAAYLMEEGSDELRVPLGWQDNGIKVNKTLVFTRNSHVIDVEYDVTNHSDQPWQGNQYRQIVRTPLAERSGLDIVMYTFNGAAYYSEQDKFEKIGLADIEDDPLSKDIKGGWIGMIQHYFLSAWIPDQSEINNFYTRTLKRNRVAIGMISPEILVPPDQSGKFVSRFYAGPKEQQVLENLAPGLELSVDYSWLTIIAKPIFWLMTFIHDNVVGNWGWSIILLTLVIKLALFKLSEYGYRSMANMRRVQPKLMSLKERFGDDKQRMQRAMMDLYKKEKINPMSGCFPILLQIPVFIALYWVLLESVELRHAPFILWIDDLSEKDPYFVLPIIMGATMFFQQKLNPAPIDEMQQTIMKVLPVLFTIFFLFFPSGLVLYWVVNNVLSIAQQWIITRRIDRGEGKP